MGANRHGGLGSLPCCRIKVCPSTHPRDQPNEACMANHTFFRQLGLIPLLLLGLLKLPRDETLSGTATVDDRDSQGDGQPCPYPGCRPCASSPASLRERRKTCTLPEAEVELFSSRSHRDARPPKPWPPQSRAPNAASFPQQQVCVRRGPQEAPPARALKSCDALKSSVL